MVLTYTIFKLDLGSSFFTFNNSVTTKIKKLDGHIAKNWTLIKI